MGAEHQITRKAADGTLSIAELRQFLDEFDKSAVPSSAPEMNGLRPKARVSFGGGLKSITVTIPGGEAE
jgi:hypothetical protein